MLDSNVVSFSPVDPEQGGDFVLKRVGSKIMIRVKSKSDPYDVVVGACLLAIKKYIPTAVVSQTQGTPKWDESIQYFQFVNEAPAPVVYPAQAKKVSIDFEWNSGAPSEDCESVLEDIRALLAGTATGISIKFDKPD